MVCVLDLCAGTPVSSELVLCVLSETFPFKDLVSLTVDVLSSVRGRKAYNLTSGLSIGSQPP